MKIKIPTALILFLSITAFCQDAKEILKQSYDKCQSVQNGYYEMTKYMKYMSGNDTSVRSFHCNFKKLQGDTLFPSAFHYHSIWNGKYIGQVMYTGDDFVRTYAKDSSAIIMSKVQWAKEINSISHNFEFYSPLTNHKNIQLPHDSTFSDENYIFKYIGEENLNGTLCYHIQLNQIPGDESGDMMKTLRHENHYWINKIDMIPVQYSIAYDLVMNNDTMYQYEKIVLDKYEINNLKDESVISLSSIPEYYKIKDYEPYERPELLKIDSLAPDWELYSLTDELISLKSLQGQVVLIDFFYKSCYPCMLALPGLQALHEKYKDKGLKVIGIDPYDKKEEGIGAFLSKRGVTYDILLGGTDVAKDYRVSGYPTMYLVDRTGKIIFVQAGYAKSVDELLEKVISDNL
ncbi:MAG: TlpA family protein disulfide reductase [Saprospiraceae bacterium]|nr:TlpA family protein disulfide reductase [Saprospiraceae bacterium]